MAILTDLAERLERKKFGFSEICKSAGFYLENASKGNASWKDRTSHARGLIHSTVNGGGEVFNINVAHGVDYGVYLEEGTRPHVIKARNKKGLYWGGVNSSGGPLIVPYVNHTGTKAYKGIKTTIHSEFPQIAKTLGEYWSDL